MNDKQVIRIERDGCTIEVDYDQTYEFCRAAFFCFDREDLEELVSLAHELLEADGE